MRIISKSKDYYDSAQGYGIDPTIVYERKEQTFSYRRIAGVDNEWDMPRSFDDENGNYVGFIILGFCGQLYPAITVSSFYESNDRFTAYTEDERLAIFKQRAVRDYRYRSKPLNQFFIDFSKKSDDLFIKYSAPIFKIEIEYGIFPGDQVSTHNTVIRTNINLAHYEFYRIKDAFTAYQEIAHYMSNVLVNRKEPEEIDDKYKLLAKGFDSKTSFRHPVK